MIIDVIDLDIDSLNFSKVYTNDRQMRAKKLHKKGYIEIREVDKIDEETYNVKSYVEGTYSFYNVFLKIHNNMVKEYSCDCKDFEKGNICKHILATCLEVIAPNRPSTSEGKKREQEFIEEQQKKLIETWKQQQEEERKRWEYEHKYSDALDTIRQYKNYYENTDYMHSSNKNLDVKEIFEETKSNINLKQENIYFADCIKIEPNIQLNNASSLDITFKIGQTTKYVLKDIEEFYNAFNNSQVLQYGKKLKFVAKRENFYENDLELLDYILHYGEMIKYSNQAYENTYYYYSRRMSGKTITVYEEKIDSFFELMKNREINIDGNSFEFTNEKLNINLQLKKDENEYTLNMNIIDYDYLISTEKIYIFLNNKIYTFNKNNNQELPNILNLFSYSNELLIPEDKFNEFSMYVFPKMEKYLSIDNSLQETAKDVILLNKLASKMYLDIDDKGNITMELKFCYLDYEFNILDKDYKKYVKDNNIERNIIEEKNVLTRIFTDGFELVNGKKYFILKNLDDIYDFLSNKIESYMNDFEILVTDKFKNTEIKKPKISSVSVKLNNGLLELDISKLDFNIDEVKNVLKNYSVKKKYYKLKNGDFLSLDKNEDLEFLNEISNSLDIDYNKINKGIIKLPVNRSIYLDQLLNKNDSMNTTKNNEFSSLVNNIENRNFSEEIVLDKNFEKILRDYQKTGYKWLKVLEKYQFGGILADDMGLGKTLQIIAILASNTEDKKPSIVVCPSSLVLNWNAEIEKWCPKLKVCIIKGDAENRKKLIESYEKFNLLVTSYDLLKRDISEYEGKNFKYIIADEAQYIKNFTTQNATALKSLEGEIKFALTGTPIENSISELWSIFDFIMPGYLYSYNKFKKKIEEPILKQEDKEALNKLKTLINPFILRRIKKDVLTELPEKNITVMKNEMTDEQYKIYMSYFVQTKKEIAQELNENSFEKSKFKILMLLTRLRQICCHPSLFIENYNGGSGKLNQCIDILNDAIDSGHKILLFSSYTSMFEIIEEKLKTQGIKYFKLTGDTPVNKRIELVDNFNKDEDIKIFLISLKAGGTGLNLTGADVVIHFDPWWNVSSENQATDRAYRIGQKNSVQVYKLITTNSIEEKINALQEKKAELSKQLLTTEETFINKLSKEEIMALFE